MMDTTMQTALDAHLKAVDAAVEKYEGQVKEAGKASSDATAAVKTLSEEFKAKMAEVNASLIDIAQKQTTAPVEEKTVSAAEEFVKSEDFTNFAAGGKSARVRLEVKNTVLADNTTTTWFDQRPGVVPGAFKPLTVYQSLPQYRTNTDTVVLMREASFTNNARWPGSHKVYRRIAGGAETLVATLPAGTTAFTDSPR